MLNISANVSHGQFYAFYFWSAFFAIFILLIIDNVEEYNILTCVINSKIFGGGCGPE